MVVPVTYAFSSALCGGCLRVLNIGGEAEWAEDCTYWAIEIECAKCGEVTRWTYDNGEMTHRLVDD